MTSETGVVENAGTSGLQVTHLIPGCWPTSDSNGSITSESGMVENLGLTARISFVTTSQ